MRKKRATEEEEDVGDMSRSGRKFCENGGGV